MPFDVSRQATCRLQALPTYPRAVWRKLQASDRRTAKPKQKRRYVWASLPQTYKELLTFDDFAEIAKARGMSLFIQQLGPFYRIECREGSRKGDLLGTTNGFTVPALKLMHCDTMQIFCRGERGEVGDRQRGGILGLGTLMASAVFSHGYWSGCRKAEILAINDNDYTHGKLKRYYSRMFGFQEIRELGENGLSDLPHLLVWGGIGTRMDGDLEKVLRKCSRTFQRSFKDAARA